MSTKHFSVSRIYAIALNTFREAVRDKVLYGMVGFSSLILAFTLALGELSLDQERRVVKDLGLAWISLFSVVVAIFLGSSLLYKEIERKTLYVILPKPIRRHEFLLGKYLGIVATSVTFIMIMGAIVSCTMAIQAGTSQSLVLGIGAAMLAVFGAGVWWRKDPAVVIPPWALVALVLGMFIAFRAQVDIKSLIAALILNTGEVAIVTAIAILFSSFSTPFLTGAFTFGIWTVGRGADDMIDFQGREVGQQLKTTLRWISEVAPNLSLYVPGENTLTTVDPKYGGIWGYVGYSMSYALLYIAIVLLLAIIIFRRRDFL